MPALPNLKQLLIPHKHKAQGKQSVNGTDYANDMRAIETWSQHVGGGMYASLTGPGQTISPGSLTQSGDFEVNGTDSSGFGLNGGVFGVNAANGVSIISSVGATGPINIEVNPAGGLSLNPASLTCALSGGQWLQLKDANGNVAFQIQANARTTPPPTMAIGFFGSGGWPQITVTGAKGGNAALANLLTALAQYGLIIDNTT
jgi:hypothetical protein